MRTQEFNTFGERERLTRQNDTGTIFVIVVLDSR